MAVNPIQELRVTAPAETTVLGALMATHKVETGFVCASEKDIRCVDGVCNDPKKGLYWTIEVNGDFQNVNSQSPVTPYDQLVLKYASSEGK